MIYELPDKNVLPHTEIEKIVSITNHGSVPMTLEISQGQIVGIQGVSFKSNRYKDQDTQAISDFVEALRASMDSAVHGTLSATFVLKEGKIVEVITQTGFKVVFKR